MTILVRHAFYSDSPVCAYDLATDHIQVNVTKDDPYIFVISSSRYPRPLKISSKVRDQFLATLDAFVHKATSGARRATMSVSGPAVHVESDLLVLRIQSQEEYGQVSMANVYNV